MILLGHFAGSASLEARVQRMFAGGVPGLMIDPWQMSNCYQDAALTTLVDTLGDPIGSTLDLSGNGKHPAQATSASRPTFQNAAVFDGVDDGWVTPSIDFSGTSKLTIIAAIRKAGGTGFQCVAELGTGTTTGGFSFHAPTSSNDDFGGYLTGASTADRNFTRTTGIYPPPTTKVVTIEFDRSAPLANDQVVIRVNGTVAPKNPGSGVTTAAFTAGPINLGNRSGASFWFNGLKYRVAMIGRALSPAELSTAERWANQPVGVL